VKIRRPLTCGGATLAHQELAGAVIHRALLDINNPRLSEAARESARRFVTGSPECVEWCAVAGLDPELVIERARRILEKIGAVKA
jgi:hypothetical protein